MCTTGRREQKKAAIREALKEAALRMFEENGYAHTTVKDIAAAAGVTERTFFRHFPSKEDLVLGEVLDFLPALQASIRSRPPQEEALTAVLNGLLAAAASRGSTPAIILTGPPIRFVAAPTRPAKSVLFDFEAGIAEVLAERLAYGAPQGGDAAALSFRASVLARAAVAAMRSALIAHADREGDRPDPEAMADLLRDAFAVLQR